MDRWMRCKQIKRREFINIVRMAGIILAAVLFGLWGGRTVYAADDIELDLTKGDIVISTDGYTQDGGSEKEGPGSDGSYIITSGGKETDHVVTVVSGKRHSITFNKVRINTNTGSGYNPLYIASIAKVSLTLRGENILTSKEYAGIAVPEGASLQIQAQSGGTLEAWASVPSSGAGIGGTLKNNKGKDEKNGKCGTIEVKSGVITTTSIGGVEGSAASGSLSSGDGGTAWIDTGSMNADMKEFTSGIVFSGNDGHVYGSYTLKREDMKVPSGKTLTIDSGKTLEIPKKYPLTLEGNLMNSGTLRIGGEDSLKGDGWIGGDGEFYILCGVTEDMFEVPDKVLYGTGEDHTEYVKKFVKESVKAEGTAAVKNRIFTRSGETDWGMEIEPSKVIEKGTYTVIFTDPEDESNQVKKSFEVLDAGEMTGIVLTTPPEKTQYIYEERFNKKGMVVKATYSSGAEKVLENSKIRIKDGRLSVGQTSVTLLYKEDGKEATCSVEITVSPKEIDASKINWEEKTATSFEYDGTEKTLNFRADLPDGVKVAIGGNSSATNAGDYAVTIDFFLEEDYAVNYVLVGNTTISTQWSILPQKLKWDTSGLEAYGNTRDDEAYIYGELGVEGILPADAGEGKLRTSFQADELTGSHENKEGDNEDIKIVWTDPYKIPDLGMSELSKNYSLPEELPTVSGIINDVKQISVGKEALAKEGVTYRMDMEKGISKVPEGLENHPNLDMPSEIEKSLIKAVMKEGIRQTYIDVHDLTLLEKKTGDSKWEKVETESIPEEGITVTVPYPDGITRKTYDGVVAYIYPCDLEWEEAGKIIYPEVTETKKGIRFTIPVSGPVAIGWKEAK
ncbi:MAG: hypothetical protein HFG89_02135 [Dorea sp.]|jgi:hypothetical protein|nr:hypothetical protein [Dorea sp.]